MNIAESIQAIINEEKYGEYLAGSLCFKNDEGKLVMLCVDGRGSIDGESYTQTSEERTLTCRAYLKYKTPEHTLWENAKAGACEPQVN